jgi:hypothetical protein
MVRRSWRVDRSRLRRLRRLLGLVRVLAFLLVLVFGHFFLLSRRIGLCDFGTFSSIDLKNSTKRAG